MEKEINKIIDLLDDLKTMTEEYEEQINDLKKYVSNLETENEHHEEIINELSLEVETLKKKVIVLEADLVEASIKRIMFISKD